MPTAQDEDWRRTDLSALAFEDLAPFGQAPYDPVAEVAQLPRQLRGILRDKGQPDGGLLVQHDSQVVYASLAEEAAAQGVVFTSLEQAARERPELVEPYLMTRCVRPEHGKFAALNGALWSGGVFVHVPREVEVALPLRVLHWLGTAGLATFPRTLIVLEAGAKLTFSAEQFSPAMDGQALQCGVAEVYLEQGAQLYHVSVQQQGRGVYNLGTQRHLLGRDAKLESVTIGLGGRLTKSYVESLMEGPGASARMLGVIFGDGDQHFDYQTLQEHIAPQGSSELLFKVVVKDQAMSVHLGKVKVHREARGTDAGQAVRNLLLSKGAKAHPILPLEIEASDIRRCNHAAAIGQLDESELFYLMSRGLDRRGAQKLIIDGFFEPVLAAIPVPAVQRRLRRAVDQKLGVPSA
jgi:Fe-S cluster assembly protein SufD